MKKHIYILVLFMLISDIIYCQKKSFHFPAEQINKFNEFAYQKICSGYKSSIITSENNSMKSGFLQNKKLQESLVLSKNYLSLKGTDKSSHDTLIITDTLTISGTWEHKGTIIIINDGLLQFKNANATILGDIFLMGTHPKLIADSSTLYIPQQYFYQRSLVITGGGKVIYHNTILDHSGLSHNIVATDSAYLELKNVTNIGFTTNGLYGHPVFNINRTNEAGEYVITDYANLTFKNANTVLLWHQFPDSADVNFSFPSDSLIRNYAFNKTVLGVKGVEYSIIADSCTNVMWGMMPSTGSNVVISNSDIRTIGLWFTGSDTLNINGLVDNSTYSNFTANLSDRNLQLINSKVKTWSIYPMEKTVINLTGCIVGEIGTMGRSHLTASNIFCDGSGGYVWTSDTSFMVIGFSSTSGYVRSQGNGILLNAYSSIMNGYASALKNSILMVIQSNVTQEPKAFDGGVAWFAQIDEPYETYEGKIVPITGSAWIDKTPTSNLMDFQSYHLYYQKNGETSWTEILSDSLVEKRKEILGTWDTHGLLPGQYNLKLVLRDNWGNPIEGIKGVNVLPAFMGFQDNESINNFNIYPNPVNDKLDIVTPAETKNISINIYNTSGQLILCKNDYTINNHSYELDLTGISEGLYYLNINSGKLTENKIISIIH